MRTGTVSLGRGTRNNDYARTPNGPSGQGWGKWYLANRGPTTDRRGIVSSFRKRLRSNREAFVADDVKTERWISQTTNDEVELQDVRR